MRGWQRLATTAAVLATVVGSAWAEDVVFARHLALSPDGSTLAFSWAGDVWTVTTEGGLARRLTAHPEHDAHPVWSRDGRWIAFSSERYGAANVFVMRSDGTTLQRLTYGDQGEVPSGFSPDAEWVYFHATREGDVFREPRMYRVPRTGGQSWRVLDCFGHAAQVSPDGETIAFVRGRTRWWRRGYRGSPNFELFTYDRTNETFRRITEFDGTDRLPFWNADGTGLYFLSDRGGTKNVWYRVLDESSAEPITHMTVDDVRDIAVSADGSTLAFTHWRDVYVQTLPDGPARKIEVNAPADDARTDRVLRTLSRDADEAEPSPDGEEVALVVEGEILVIKTEEDRRTRRVTESPARDRHVTWSPDGKALYFVSDRQGQEDIYRATSAEEPPAALSDSLRFTIERVVGTPEMEYDPQVAPDGKQLAYVRGRGDLIIRDLKSGDERVLLEGWNRPVVRWSPDSKWLAFEREDIEHNPDVWIVPADGSAPPVNISQHPDHDGYPQWSADGQILTFASRRHGFDADLYMVFLSPALHEKSSVDLDLYFDERGDAVKKRKPLKKAVASGTLAQADTPASTQSAATTPADADAGASNDVVDDLRDTVRTWLKELLEDEKKKPARTKKDAEAKPGWELATAYERVRRVTSLDGDQTQYALSPDGRTLAFESAHTGSARVYTVQWNGEQVKRIVSSGVGALRWTLDGKRLFFIRAGVPNSCTASGSDDKRHEFQMRLRLSHAARAAQKFADGARQLGLRFYHPTMKGLDWAALTEKYMALALNTSTLTEFNEVFNMLLGELNASHLGIYGPGWRRPELIGYLGVEFDSTYPGPGLKVEAVLPRSPADRAESRLVPGDVLMTVDGQPVGPQNALEEVLVQTIGEEIIVRYQPSPARPTAATQPATDQVDNDPELGEVVIRPIGYGQFRDRAYDAWVHENRAYVEAQSDGRVGYVHIRAMGQNEFEVFERDLYAAAHGKDGLIIDVRNNGGGWTADWVLAVLSPKRHAYTIPRGGVPGYPQGRLIFYSWIKPATMLCNQHSFSNAEIISHAFKNLARGPLVGMTTPGGVISTGAYYLIDGALVRMPFRGWYTLPHEVDMELNGAEPDVKVPVTPRDEVLGRFPQLDAAIAATMKQLARPEVEGED